MKTAAKRARKYEPLQLVEMFRLAGKLRAEMLAAGFTDNGGAVHSAERILNLLGLRACYPTLRTSTTCARSQTPNSPRRRSWPTVRDSRSSSSM